MFSYSKPEAMYTESASMRLSRGGERRSRRYTLNRRKIADFSINNISSSCKAVIGKMLTRFCAKGLNFGLSLAFGKILMRFRATDSNFGLSRGTRPRGVLC